MKINLQGDGQHRFAFCSATNVTFERLSVRIFDELVQYPSMLNIFFKK